MVKNTVGALCSNWPMFNGCDVVHDEEYDEQEFIAEQEYLDGLGAEAEAMAEQDQIEGRKWVGFPELDAKFDKEAREQEIAAMAEDLAGTGELVYWTSLSAKGSEVTLMDSLEQGSMSLAEHLYALGYRKPGKDTG